MKFYQPAFELPLLAATGQAGRGPVKALRQITTDD